MLNRNEIAPEFKWKLSDIFETPEAWEARLAECEAMLPSLSALRGTLGTSAESLFRAYETLFAFEEKSEHVGDYAFLGKALDGGDTAFLARCERVQALAVKAAAATSFFEPELMAIPAEALAAFMKYPPLAKYAHIIEDSTRLRDHVLDEKSEGILAKFGRIRSTPSSVYKIFTNVEMKIPPITDENGREAELTQGNFRAFRESPKKEVRDAAFKAMFGTYGAHIGTFAALYAGQVK